MGDFKTELEITADASQAEDALESVEYKAGPALQKAMLKTGKAVEKVGSKLKSMSGKAVAGAKVAAKGLGAVGAAAAGAGALVVKLVDGFTKLEGQAATAKLFGGTAAGAKAVKAALDNTITSAEALIKSSRLAMLGFDSPKAQKKVMLMARALSTVRGESIDAGLEMIKSGEFVGRMGDKYANVAIMIEAAITKQSSFAMVSLTAAQKAQIAYKIMTREAGGFLKKLNEVNKPSVMAQVMASLRELGNLLLKKVGPYVRRFVDDFKKGLPEVRKKFEELSLQIKEAFNSAGVVKFFTALSDGWSKFIALRKKLGSLLGPTGTLDKKQADKLLADIKAKREKRLGYSTADEEKEARQASNKRMQRLIVDRSKDIKSSTDSEKKKQGALTKIALTDAQRRAKALKDRRDRYKAMVQTEVAEERKGFQAEARSLTRNFRSAYTDAVSAMGGSFSGIIASQKDFYEQARIFSSLYGRSVQDSIGMSDKAIRNSKDLSKDQKKATLLLKRRSQAGARDAKEKFLMEKNVIEQMKAGLSLSAADQKLAALRVEERMHEIDVLASVKSIKLMIEEIDSRGAEADKSDKFFYTDKLKKYNEISKTKKEIFRQTRVIAKQEKESEERAKKAAREDVIRGATDKLIALRRELLAISDPSGAAQQGIADAARARVSEMEVGIRNQMNLIKALRPAQKAEISAQTTRLQLMQKQLAVTKEINKQTAARNTVAGRFIDLMKAELIGLTEKTAQMFKGMSDSVLGGMGSLVSGFFETMIVDGVGGAAANAGKMFLDVLAGAAAQMGAYFMAVGAAQMWVPPYTGAFAIAGGLGLLALSGILKGTGSLIGASAPSTSTPTGGGGTAPSAPPSSLPGQKTPQDMRPVQFLFSVSQEPWSAPDDQTRFNNLKRWSRKMGRSTGIADPFAFAAKVGGRGR